MNVFFDSCWQRNVQIVGELVVDRCDWVGRVTWFGIGARDNRCVITLAKAPETIPIEVVNPEIALSSLGQGIKNVAREVDDVRRINLLMNGIQATSRDLEKICRPENRFIVRTSWRFVLAASKAKGCTNEHQNRKNHRNQV